MARPRVYVPEAVLPEDSREWPVFAEAQNRWWATADELLATKHTLAIIGGNRSSKSRWAWSRVVRACLGAYAWCPVPASCCVISLSKNQGSSAFQEYIERYALTLPKGVIQRQTTREELTSPIRFGNGSVIHVKTIEMGASRIQGGGYNLVVVDEEDTQLRRIHKELVARTRAGVPLKIVFTAAPTLGITYLCREVIDKAREKDIAVLPVAVFENAEGECQTCHTSRETWDARLRELQIDARGSWTHAQLGRLCPRCYTFGEEPRIQPSDIKRWNEEYTTRAEIGVRFYGEWPRDGGLSCFGSRHIAALRRAARPLLRREGPCLVWDDPTPGHHYGGAVDVAHGTDRDETVHTLADAATREQVYLYADARTEPAAYVGDVVEVAHEYGRARHWVENIGAGIFVIDELLAAGIPLYKHRSPTRRVRAAPRMELGARPSPRSREAILERMITAVKKGLKECCGCHFLAPCPDGKPLDDWTVVRGQPGAIYVNDPETINQLERLQWPHEQSPRIDVDEGHDDRAMALAGVVEVLRDQGLGAIPLAPAARVRREDTVQRTWLTRAAASRWGRHPLDRWPQLGVRYGA